MLHDERASITSWRGLDHMIVNVNKAVLSRFRPPSEVKTAEE